MVYNGTANNMQSRTVPAIALKPSNQHGGSFFMSLLSGQKLHAYHWEEIPISDEVIDRVHYLAKEEKQPALVNGQLIFEWDTGRPIQDNIDFINETDEYDVIADDTNIEQIGEYSGSESSVSGDADISYDSDSDNDEHHSLQDDLEQHSIDGFLEDELISEG